MLLALHGCASASEVDEDDDEISQVLGAAFHGPEGGGELGAFADAAQLARGKPLPGFRATGLGILEGRHDDAVHRYAVVCFDELHVVLDGCAPGASRALVIATWDGRLDTVDHPGRVHRTALWTFDDPCARAALVTGASWLWYEAPAYDLREARDLRVEMDMEHRFITSGFMRTQITMETGDARRVRGVIELTAETATISLGGRRTGTFDITPVSIR